jgi:hypothetical protein
MTVDNDVDVLAWELSVSSGASDIGWSERVVYRVHNFGFSGAPYIYVVPISVKLRCGGKSNQNTHCIGIERE